MRVVLSINDVDFTPWIAENGIRYSSINRLTRSVITLDGTKHQKSVEKNKLDIAMLDIPDEELAQIEEALLCANPALVDYTDKRGVLYTGVPFYTTAPEATAERVIGSTTYFGNVTFSMEEK